MDKKIFFLLIMISLCFFVMNSCQEKAQYSIQFENENLDFGTVDGGTTVSVNFKLKNTGKEVLEIKAIRPTCGCTVPGKWDKTLKSGKKGTIPIAFDTEAYDGNVTKEIFVDTNVPGKESIRLTLKGFISNPVKINPTTLPLGDIVNEAAALHGSYEIRNNEQVPLRIVEIVPPDGKTTFQLTTITPDQVYRLDITVNPPFEKDEVISKFITLKTKNSKEKTYKLTYTYFVPPPIQVNPLKVEIYIDKVNIAKIERRINIKSNIDAPISIIDPQLDGTGLEYSVETLLKDKFYQIFLVFPEGFAFPDGKPIFYLSFKVQNDPRNNLYIIPISESKTKSDDSFYG